MLTWWGANIAIATVGTLACRHALDWALRGAEHAGHAGRRTVGTAPAARVAAAGGPAAIHAVRGPAHELPVPLHELLLVLLRRREAAQRRRLRRQRPPAPPLLQLRPLWRTLHPEWCRQGACWSGQRALRPWPGHVQCTMQCSVTIA